MRAGCLYGPDNPHPLSNLQTELVWEGKYDAYGNRRVVDTANLSWPLQKIETVDEPRARSAAQGDLFDEGSAHHDGFRNRLVWGDNKLVMASLLAEFRGAVDLIYIDPPFDIGADFTLNVGIGEESEEIFKDQSILEMVAYRDMWGKGTDSYLNMLYERLALMKELLSDTGSIYVHCDPTASHYIKIMMDDIFGHDNFQNEIVWAYRTGGNSKQWFARKHDILLFYSNGGNHIFNLQKEKAYTKAKGRKAGKMNYGAGTAEFYEDENGVYNLVNMRDVWDIPYLNSQAKERLDYATQKPEALLERIIKASSNEGDLVADFFCGSGTSLVAAEKLNRRWIGSDLGRFAIHTSRKRLIGTQRDLHADGVPYRSFDLYNLGRYERQWWQQDALKGADTEHRAVVLKFFRAEALVNTPSPLIHGRRGAALVHVDGIDSIFTREEVLALAKAVKASGAKQVHCLAWDFEMDLRQAADGIESTLDIEIKLHRIPREIMERNRSEVPPFFEIALLQAAPVYKSDKQGKKTADIKLVNFIPSLTEVPSRELEALQERTVKSGFDFIDFWAIDFDWSPDQPFNHHWQDYRTRKDRRLKTISTAGFSYDTPGPHTACVKVVDVFGCDTSITVEVAG